MERKEELQEQCQSLKKLLEKESASSGGLKQELNEANRKAKGWVLPEGLIFPSTVR